MAHEIPFEGICSTNFGRFRIKIDDTSVRVGGGNYCVNIALKGALTELSWLSTAEGGCELDGVKIHGQDTIKMVDLAFSLLRKYYPERNSILLLDDSGISWPGPRRTKIKINFIKGYLLLHRKTWYEEKFDARMVKEEAYTRYRHMVDNNFDDPTKKPEEFDFGSASDVLTPLYRDSRTWGEFLKKFINQVDNTKKYEMMYDWYRHAILYIFEGEDINQYWKIDVTVRPFYECNSPLKTGGRYTRHQRRATRLKNRVKPFSAFHPIGPYQYKPRNEMKEYSKK